MPRETTLSRLKELCETVPAKLRNFSSEEFARKPSGEKWSKKEILGHLIDSATNNHHRFVRAQYEDSPKIKYSQVDWNNGSRYNDIDASHLIAFWELYNRHLIEIAKRIPESALSRTVDWGEAEKPTLGFVIDDYLRHLEHHLGQILGG